MHDYKVSSYFPFAPVLYVHEAYVCQVKVYKESKENLKYKGFWEASLGCLLVHEVVEFLPVTRGSDKRFTINKIKE
jgi:hypothetical protein